MSREKIALICLLVFAFMLPEATLADIGVGPLPFPAITQENEAAFTENNFISREEAKVLFIKAFPEITREMALEVDQEGNSFSERPSWNFSSPEIGVRPGSGYRVLSGSIDALTGRVLTMNYNPLPEYYQGRQVRLTREEALQKARSFLLAMIPEKIDSLKLDPGVMPIFNPNTSLTTYYSFSWSRVVDGAAVNWDRVIVGVDAYTGLITHYNCSLNETQFSPGEIKFSRDDVISTVLNQAGIYPTYKYSTAEGNVTGQIIPVYELNTEAMYVDALTGKLLDSRGQELSKEQIKIYNREFTPQLNEPAINEPALTEEEVDLHQAQETARQFIASLGYEGEIIKSGGGGGSGPGYADKHWFFSLRSEEPGNPPGLRVEINAHSGEITGFYKRENNNSHSANPVSLEQALQIAQQAIKKYSPEKEKLLVLKQQSDNDFEPGKYTFTFDRMLNGLPFDRDSVTVTISQSSGDILGYHTRWRPVECSSLNQVIEKTRIEPILAQQLNMELVHMSPLNRNYEQTGETRLAYLISRPRVDAVSGKMIYGGKAVPDAPDANTTLTGHWSAPALSMLNENGLFTDTINPDAAVTRREALKAIIAATNPRAYYSYSRSKQVQLADIKDQDPDYETFALAVSRGIIPSQGSFKPNDDISRQELAVWVTKSLGYDHIAQIKNPITTPVQDADKIIPDHYNYVGLTYGLGIITPDAENRIRPLDKVSQAEMAIIATRLLAYANPGY